MSLFLPLSSAIIYTKLEKHKINTSRNINISYFLFNVAKQHILDILGVFRAPVTCHLWLWRCDTFGWHSFACVSSYLGNRNSIYPFSVDTTVVSSLCQISSEALVSMGSLVLGSESASFYLLGSLSSLEQKMLMSFPCLAFQKYGTVLPLLNKPQKLYLNQEWLTLKTQEGSDPNLWRTL